MVRFGFASSSSGALRVNDQTIRITVRIIAARNSIRIR
jgi:hypothetical protein